MNNTLYLTTDEAGIASSLPAPLREGWTVQSCTITPERPEELSMRMQMASFQSPAIQAALEAAKKATDAASMEKVAAMIDVQSMSQQEQAELFFILGTRWMGHIISYALQHATKDEDLEGIAALSSIRMALSESNAAIS